MPTERFYKLGDDKKNSIRKAVIQEFTRVPYEKASINQIIFNAGISRGSFYTYFEDKKDVLIYILGDSVEKMKNMWVEFLEHSQGDIFSSTEQLLVHVMESAAKSGMFEMMRNLEFSRDAEAIFEQSHTKECNMEHGKRAISLLYEKTDKSRFKCHDREKFEKFFWVLFVSVISSLNFYYRKPEEEENIKKNFHEVLEILQYGICK